MNWRDQLSLFERTNDRAGALRLLQDQHYATPEIYLRVIFIFLDFVVEYPHTQEEHDYASKCIKRLFNTTRKRFFKNAEFSFFMGIMIYMGEWYFGLDDVSFADELLVNATRMEPDNTLYRWGYHVQINQRLSHNTRLKWTLSKRLLYQEPEKISWLKTKGLLGIYVLGTLESIYEHLQDFRVCNGF